MATVQQTPFADGATSATQLQQRDVHDKLRYVGREKAKLLSIVASGPIDGEGNGYKTQKGMINKRRADSNHVEAFYHLPIGATKTVTAVNGLAVTFSDVLDVRVRQKYQNTKNNTEGYVQSISNNTATFVSLGTTFSAEVGDVLMKTSNAYEDASSSPTYVQKEDDRVDNYLHEVRYPVEIGRQALTTKQLAGGNKLERMRKYAVIRALFEVECTMLFGRKAASGATTTITSVGEVRTTQGFYNFAQSTYNAGGGLTPEKLAVDLPLAFHESISGEKDMICTLGDQGFGKIIRWMQEKLIANVAGKQNVWGLYANEFVTQKNKIHFIEHQAFNYGDNVSRGLCLIPEDLEYIYKDMFDLKLEYDIQANDKHSKKDELTGIVGCLPLEGGYGLVKLEGLV